MKLRDVVIELVWPEDDGRPDPTKPENSAGLRKDRELAGKVLINWLQNHGGSYLIADKARALEEKLMRLVSMKRVTQDERDKALALLDEITYDVRFVHEIQAAVKGSESLAAEINGPARDTKGEKE